MIILPLLYHTSNLADKLRQFAVIIHTTYQVQMIEVVKTIKVNSRRVSVHFAQIKLQNHNKMQLELPHCWTH